MQQYPTLHTQRLVLRPFVMGDARDVQRLAGERAIADTTLNIPHPYADGIAEQWIAGHQAQFDADERIIFAIVQKESGALIGTIGLINLSVRDERGELAYWIGRPYWDQGFCTEAARAVLAYGFDALGFNRIEGRFLKRNPASGRVMEKIGMSPEGCQRAHTKKWDRLEDMVLYSILKSEWQGEAGQTTPG